MPREPLAAFAAFAKERGLRRESSSGGVFSLLARCCLSSGGVVYGARFDRSDWRVIHAKAESEADLSALRGSKYVQSDMGSSLRELKRDVAKNRHVIFAGTPCQVAGARSVIGDSANVLYVDVICHGVPSPLAWRRYLAKRVRESYGPDTKQNWLEDLAIRQIAFRCKDCGWKRYAVSLNFANDMVYFCDVWHDPFMRGFLADLYNRPSCHVCPMRNLKSGSDITIGDFWGVGHRYPEMDDDNGTSLVLLNTDKGLVAWKRIEPLVRRRETDYAHACECNLAIIKSTPPHPKRADFFRKLDKEQDFDLLTRRMLQPSILRRWLGFVTRTACRLGGGT